MENDGGPAFPGKRHESDTSRKVGMSLRDYFAAHAMIGLITAKRGDERVVAKLAYEHADLMLAERSKTDS